MLRALLFLFRPLHTIAKELAIIRELYEADLQSRERPVYRVTEKPSSRDTEVMYTDEEKKPVWKRWDHVSDEVLDDLINNEDDGA